MLLGEDAAGVVQVLGELRDPEVTRYLLALAERPALPPAVRARAIGAIEADQGWERDALTELAHRKATGDDANEAVNDALRAAAVQALGAFTTGGELLDRVGDLAAARSPAIRGALLWALQLAARTAGDAPAITAVVAPMLDDGDPQVRRRAAYVAGNLGLAGLATAPAPGPRRSVRSARATTRRSRTWSRSPEGGVSCRARTRGAPADRAGPRAAARRSAPARLGCPSAGS